MGKAKMYLRLFTRYAYMVIKSDFSYNSLNGIYVMIVCFIGYAGDGIAVWATMRAFPGAGGYNAMDALVIYGVVLMGYALASTFSHTFWQFDDLVLKGELDDYLVRPVSPFIHIMLKGAVTGHLAHFSVGLLIALIALGQLALGWSILAWAMFVLTVLTGGMIQFAFSQIAAILAFWWGKSSAAGSFMRYTLRGVVQYPASIYPNWIVRILTVVPYTFLGYYQLSYLLGKNPDGIWLPVVGFGAAILTNLFLMAEWRLGLKSYSSAGG